MRRKIGRSVEKIGGHAVGSGSRTRGFMGERRKMEPGRLKHLRIHSREAVERLRKVTATAVPTSITTLERVARDHWWGQMIRSKSSLGLIRLLVALQRRDTLCRSRSRASQRAVGLQSRGPPALDASATSRAPARRCTLPENREAAGLAARAPHCPRASYTEGAQPDDP